MSNSVHHERSEKTIAPRSRPRVVLVDDDPTTRAYVRAALAPLELDLQLSANAETFRATRSKHKADLCIIDVDLPDCAGHQLAEEIGAYAEPMIFFSVHDDAGSRLKALEAGALEYLVKPQCPREFMLRVANILALTRRTPLPVSTSARVFAGLRFDPRHRSLVGNGAEPVKLTASEANVMEMLTDTPGRTIGRYAIAARISRRTTERDPRIVDVLIYRLRRKLRDVGADAGMIVTVPFEGYAFIEPVTVE